MNNDFFTMGSDPIVSPEPYAGKLHVRFDEGAGVPCGGVPLYSTPHSIPSRP